MMDLQELPFTILPPVLVLAMISDIGTETEKDGRNSMIDATKEGKQSDHKRFVMLQALQFLKLFYFSLLSGLQGRKVCSFYDTMLCNSRIITVFKLFKVNNCSFSFPCIL
jgi:hypothetical protein